MRQGVWGYWCVSFGSRCGVVVSYPLTKKSFQKHFPIKSFFANLASRVGVAQPNEPPTGERLSDVATVRLMVSADFYPLDGPEMRAYPNTIEALRGVLKQNGVSDRVQGAHVDVEVRTLNVYQHETLNKMIPTDGYDYWWENVLEVKCGYLNNRLPVYIWEHLG